MDDTTGPNTGRRRRNERIWTVLVVTVLAAVGMSISGAVAALFVFGSRRLVGGTGALGARYLLVATAAAEGFLLLCALGFARPFSVERLRLRRSDARPLTIAAIAIGTIALGELGDAVLAVLRLSELGSLAEFRHALRGLSAGELLAAVVVLGVVAGTAEELFFRGFLQTRLAQRWRPSAAVVVTSVLFGLVHLDPLHVVLAAAIGLWLGFVTERTGSIRPAIVAHVANNVTAAVGAWAGLSMPQVGPNVVIGALALLVFATCARHVLRAHGAIGAHPAAGSTAETIAGGAVSPAARPAERHARALPVPPGTPRPRLVRGTMLVSAVILVALVVAVWLYGPSHHRRPGPPSRAQVPPAGAAHEAVPASATGGTSGPCDPTLHRFDPARVYESYGVTIRDVEDRGQVTSGRRSPGRIGAWITRAGLVYEEHPSGTPVLFRPAPLRLGVRGCEPNAGQAVPDPPYDPEAARCEEDEGHKLMLDPDGGVVWECKRPPGALKRLWAELKDDARGAPWTFFVLRADGSRVPLELGTGLCRAGRDGRLLLEEHGGLRVAERDELGPLAGLHCSTSTPIRATEDGFLVVDIDTGPVPVAWRITVRGATRVGAYPRWNGPWGTPFAIDGAGRLYGMIGQPTADGAYTTSLVRAAPGDASVELLAEFRYSSEAPVALITGP